MVSYRNGDESALGELYQISYPEFVLRYPRRNLSHMDGDDCFNEAFEVLLIRFQDPGFRLTAPAQAFLSAVFERIVLQKYRKDKRETAIRNAAAHHLTDVEESEESVFPDAEALRLVAWDQLQTRTFRLLSERCRKILSFTSEKIPTNEIAQRLDMQNEDNPKAEANAVYQLRSRCRQNWDKRLREDDEFMNCKPGRW